MTSRLAVLLGLIACTLVGCGTSRSREVLIAPRILTSPYDTRKGEALWAVVPLRNESGASIADEMLLSDRVIGAIEEVRGVRCVPLARTLAAMEALNVRSIRTPGEARGLAQAMGVDAVVVGSITAYEPYTPLLGMSLALFPRAGSPGAASGLDPHDLTKATAETASAAPGMPLDRPVAVVSERWDGKNHQVLADVRAFAEGRMKQPSALGWKRYLASMDLFSEFASYRAVDALLQQEWVRTAQASLVTPPQSGTGRTADVPESRQ